MASSVNKSRKSNKVVKVLLLTILVIEVLFVLYYLSNGASSTRSGISSLSGSTTFPLSAGCKEPSGQSHSQPQQYQYEGNPCHLFYINATISNLNYSLNGGVDAAITVYKNMLLVPMSNPMNEAMMLNMSMNGTMMPPPVPQNLPFSTPSYQAPANWSSTWGKLASYNAKTGKLLWEDSFTASVMSQPLVVNNTIYISTGSDFVDLTTFRNGIYAINATTGRPIWNLSTDAEHMPTPIYYNNTLIIVPGDGQGTDSQSLMGLNPRNGEPEWLTFIGGESAMSSPALVGNTIYFGVRLSPYQLSPSPVQDAEFAVNLDTHQVIWKDYFGGGLGIQDAPPAVWNNIVVTGYAYPTLNASGHTAPNLMDAEAAANNPMFNLQNQTLAVFMVGLNATTGKVIWNVSEGIGPNPPRSKIPAPTIYNGTVYADNTVLGMLYAINATTGRVLWTYHTGLSDPNPAIVGNYVLDVNQSGILFVMNMNGSPVRLINLGLSMGWCGSGQLAVVGNSLAIGGENEELLVLPLSSVIPNST